MARKRMDLTGQKFGRLEVLYEVPSNTHERYWLCRCDCKDKTEKIISMNLLRSKKTQSCGCLQREKASQLSLRDLTGQKFNSLQVIRRAENSEKGETRWECECDCGEIVTVVSYSLTGEKTKSCGCLRVKTGREVQEVLEKHHRKDGVMVPTLRRKTNKNNTSGVKGVSVINTPYGKRYRAEIDVKKQRIYLGTFKTKESAIEARKKAEEIYHKPYLEDREDEQ